MHPKKQAGAEITYKRIGFPQLGRWTITPVGSRVCIQMDFRNLAKVSGYFARWFWLCGVQQSQSQSTPFVECSKVPLQSKLMKVAICVTFSVFRNGTSFHNLSSATTLQLYQAVMARESFLFWFKFVLCMQCSLPSLNEQLSVYNFLICMVQFDLTLHSHLYAATGFGKEAAF